MFISLSVYPSVYLCAHNGCVRALTRMCIHAGITGKGVIVAMIDDGLDYEHPDLRDNFVRPPPTTPIHRHTATLTHPTLFHHSIIISHSTRMARTTTTTT